MFYCDDCESITTVTLEPYGYSDKQDSPYFMAVINCPKCGVSYDTNLDAVDVKQLKELNND